MFNIPSDPGDKMWVMCCSKQLELLSGYSQSREGSYPCSTIMKMPTEVCRILWDLKRTFTYLASFEIHNLVGQVKH